LKSWRIEIKPTAEKQYHKLDKKTRQRIKKALQELEKHNMPLFHPQMKPLTGKLKGDYRMRVGDWRVLLTPEKENNLLLIYAILPRGGAY
jgi:mRNA interferase RelE/StbE